jgi:hypothetical protein
VRAKTIELRKPAQMQIEETVSPVQLTTGGSEREREPESEPEQASQSPSQSQSQSMIMHKTQAPCAQAPRVVNEGTTPLAQLTGNTPMSLPERAESFMMKSPADVTKQEARAEDLAKTGMQWHDTETHKAYLRYPGCENPARKLGCETPSGGGPDPDLEVTGHSCTKIATSVNSSNKDLKDLIACADEDEVLLEPVSKSQVSQDEKFEVHHGKVEMGEVRPGLHRVEGHACPEVALLEISRVKEYEAERMSTNGEEVDAGAGARDHREENTVVKTLFAQKSPETGQSTECLERGGDGSQHAQHELITEGGNVNNPRGPEMDAFIDCAMHRNNEIYSWSARGTDGMPAVSVTVVSITDRIKAGYKAFTNGKLAESGAIFKSTLQSAMVARVDSKGELDEIREQMSV